MNALLTGILMFACLFGAAMFALFMHPRLPEPQLSKETQDVIKLGVGMIVAMATLVLGLLTASVKSSFDGVSNDVKLFATDLVLEDRTLRNYGREADAARRDLVRYTQRALEETWPEVGEPAVVEDTTAEALLDRAERSILALAPGNPTERALALQAELQMRGLIQQRWKLIEESGSTVSPIMVGVLVLWLSITFASFGYNAPRNRLVITTFFLCAASIGGAIFLIIEMDGPFDGLIRVSPSSMEVALDHMLHHQDEHVVLPPA